MSPAVHQPDPHGAARDSITVSGISAVGHHGVFEHERREGQRFVADVTMHVDTRPAAAEDRLDLTVDYGLVSEQVAAVLSGDPADLVETVAERIAAAVLTHPGVHAVDVVVHKPQAPVSVPFTDVTVRIRRDREHLPAVAGPPVVVGPAGEDDVEPSWPESARPTPAWGFTSAARGGPLLDDDAPVPGPDGGTAPVPGPDAGTAPVPGPDDGAAPAPGRVGAGPAALGVLAGAAPAALPLPLATGAPGLVPGGIVPAPPTPEDVAAGPEPDGGADVLAAPTQTAVLPVEGRHARVDPAPGAPAEDLAQAAPPRDRLDVAPAEPVEVVLALGSNLGASHDLLRRAVRELAQVPGLEITGIAPLARTGPVGGPPQPDFLNTVVIALTTLSPRDVLHACQGVEDALGRERTERWGPRTVDIDLIVHGSTVAAADDLELPHPRAHERAFVLQPWAQVRPDAVLPGLGGGPVAVLAETAPDRGGIRWMALDWWTAPEGSA